MRFCSGLIFSFFLCLWTNGNALEYKEIKPNLIEIVIYDSKDKSDKTILIKKKIYQDWKVKLLDQSTDNFNKLPRNNFNLIKFSTDQNSFAEISFNEIFEKKFSLGFEYPIYIYVYDPKQIILNNLEILSILFLFIFILYFIIKKFRR